MDRWKAIALVLGGMLLGSFIVPPRTTTAEPAAQFKECAYYCGFRGRDMANKLDKAAHPVPAGWTVVSSAAQECALMCR